MTQTQWPMLQIGRSTKQISTRGIYGSFRKNSSANK
jgi:hypothetical protein